MSDAYAGRQGPQDGSTPGGSGLNDPNVAGLARFTRRAAPDR